jgi:cation transport regulator
MPYLTTDDLPASVQDHLPPHAREIYLAAFNNAWRQHGGEPDAEATVHRIAWSAVKRRYSQARRCLGAAHPVTVDPDQRANMTKC